MEENGTFIIATALAILKSKPEKITVREHINSLRNKNKELTPSDYWRLRYEEQLKEISYLRGKCIGLSKQNSSSSIGISKKRKLNNNKCFEMTQTENDTNDNNIKIFNFATACFKSKIESAFELLEENIINNSKPNYFNYNCVTRMEGEITAAELICTAINSGLIATEDILKTVNLVYSENLDLNVRLTLAKGLLNVLDILDEDKSIKNEKNNREQLQLSLDVSTLNQNYLQQFETLNSKSIPKTNRNNRLKVETIENDKSNCDDLKIKEMKNKIKKQWEISLHIIFQVNTNSMNCNCLCHTTKMIYTNSSQSFTEITDTNIKENFNESCEIDNYIKNKKDNKNKNKKICGCFVLKSAATENLDNDVNEIFIKGKSSYLKKNSKLSDPPHFINSPPFTTDFTIENLDKSYRSAVDNGCQIGKTNKLNSININNNNTKEHAAVATAYNNYIINEQNHSNQPNNRIATEKENHLNFSHKGRIYDNENIGKHNVECANNNTKKRGPNRQLKGSIQRYYPVTPPSSSLCENINNIENIKIIKDNKDNKNNNNLGNIKNLISTTTNHNIFRNNYLYPQNICIAKYTAKTTRDWIKEQLLNIYNGK